MMRNTVSPRSRRKTLLLIALGASAVTVALDLISQWSPASQALFGEIRSATFANVPLSISRRVELLIYLGGSDGWRRAYLASHYLALIFFPLGMAGISALLPAEDRISRAARISGYFSYISGTVYHMSMSFLAAALASSDPAGWNRIISGYRPFMEPIGYLFAGGFAVVSLLYLIAERQRAGRWHGKMLSAPLFTMAAIIIISFLLPRGWAAALRITSFNAALLMTYAIHWLFPGDAEPRRSDGKGDKTLR
jgi:hypothetical protein